MASRRLLATREVARLLELPESTVRWYERQFRGFLPVERTGRGVGWHAAALPILRTIRASFATGLSREDVAHILASGPPPSEPSSATDRARQTVLAAVTARAHALEAMQADLAQIQRQLPQADLGPFFIRQSEQLTRIEDRLNTLFHTLQQLDGRLARLEPRIPSTPPDSEPSRRPWPRRR